MNHLQRYPVGLAMSRLHSRRMVRTTMGSIATVTRAKAMQPAESVTVTVYVVVDTGQTLTMESDEYRGSTGVQLYRKGYVPPITVGLSLTHESGQMKSVSGRLTLRVLYGDDGTEATKSERIVPV